MNISDIIKFIDTASEQDCRTLQGVLHARFQETKNDKLFTFKAGDVVRFNTHARPSYLQGTTATIRSVGRARVTVDLPHAIGRFGQYGLRCPVSIIDKI